MLVTYDMNCIAVFVCEIIIFANSMIIAQVAFSVAIMPPILCMFLIGQQIFVVYHKQ